MSDLYFNELSADFSFSNQPASKELAKGLLFQFIKTSFSYLLSSGIGSDIYILSRYHSLSSVVLYPDFTICRLINELYQESKIDEIETKRFKALINESFVEEWAPEYGFMGNQAYGMGEAHKKKSFCISICTDFIHGSEDWNQSQFQLLKVSVDEPDDNVFVRNFTTPRHVIVKYRIWHSCSFINKMPQAVLLPNRALSRLVLDAYDFSDWELFYNSVQILSKTQIFTIAKFIAIINGWAKSNICPNSFRPTYEASNWYLTVDSQHATFEVYRGKNEHLGEIAFNNDVINTSKIKNNRGVCGKKGKK